ncbi:hypothetical protein Syun_012469 [Stephania yunnanensis]|uniref:GPI ethanolamine phosphate transferase 3 n=1 Tax=Stephania yunnanensis TaxID=152371 RepID=A0AAP0K0A1_9MAGN
MDDDGARQMVWKGRVVKLGLTTGGLPTFIDIGNSFGAPAIVEDNLIYQLVQNKKRVIMMGDDTWMQLFPDHFEKSFPFPSFNVKDLDTVDDGCVQHLLPSLYEDNWEVLIAHFLGVDHVGHIFGVESFQMIEKLEQYNAILEKVVEVLKNQSGPGGLHENTLLLVMGDHGQTLNGDHGGGTAEEVETVLFAMSLKTPPASIPSGSETSCKSDTDGKMICFSSIHQLDFAATVAALLGVPFPFGSIGRVNPLLYALSAASWNQPRSGAEGQKNWPYLEEWMQNYANALCINSWQVKRYVDVYSASSVIGFPYEDLVHVTNLYAKAQDNWLRLLKKMHSSGRKIPSGSGGTSLNDLQEQIDAYSDFLASVAHLARSKWTEFDLIMMGLGLGTLLLSLLFHILAVRRTNELCKASCHFYNNDKSTLRFISALLVVAVRGCSFLSNSYILEEGKVTNFLFGTIAILNLQYSISKKEAIIQAVTLPLLNVILRCVIEVDLSKQELYSGRFSIFPFTMLGLGEGQYVWMFIPEILSVLALIMVAYMLYKITTRTRKSFLKQSVVAVTILSYVLVAVHWTIESEVLAIPVMQESVGRNLLPQIVYTIGFGLLLSLTSAQLLEKKTPNYRESTFIKTLELVSIWSPTIMILLGRQGPLIVLACMVAAYCIIHIVNLESKAKDGIVRITYDPLPVTQWNFLAVCLFFYTGHWCAFDGLRYSAAFVGFDEFNLIRQAILLGIDTFGVSHILPIFALPFLVVFQYPKYPKVIGFLAAAFVSHFCSNSMFFTVVFLIYGLITAITTTFTFICVTIHKRHLMVWGLFAPKFVFDVVGLILTDILICLSSLYYFSQAENGNNQISDRWRVNHCEQSKM